MNTLPHDDRPLIRNVMSTIVGFGALWGLVESSLGYALHLASRLVPGIGLAGLVMYPIAFALMYGAYRTTGNIFAPLLMSVIAAGIKMSSAILPTVPLLFVTNPALAILAEGAVVTLVVALTRGRTALTLGGAAIGAFAWRALFLGLVFVLPVRKGILMKGPEALMTFLLIEAAVNAGVIGVGLWFASRSRDRGANRPRVMDLLARPAVGGLLVIVAIVAEAGFSVL
jgi:hypothetical protein